MGIGKMGAGAAQLRRLLVHHLHKSRFRPGDVLGNYRRSVVGGLNHQAVQQLLQGKHLTGHETGAAAGGVQIVQRFLTDGNRICQVAMLQSQQAGHHLGQAGRLSPCVDVFGIYHGLGVQLQKEERLRVKVQFIRPGQRPGCVHAKVAALISAQGSFCRGRDGLWCSGFFGLLLLFRRGIRGGCLFAGRCLR